MVIGSDKQKHMVISQGVVPRLMTILSQENAPLCIRYDAAVVLGKIKTCFVLSQSNQFYCMISFRTTGSLSKGTEENVRALIDANLIQLLLSIITNASSDKYLMEICLCVVRSIYEHPFAPGEIINTNAPTLVYLIGKMK